MTAFRGLTWDHPRGREALRAAAAEWASHGLSLTWDVQSLEGFEASPIEELAERYDLIVLDHPHLGDALTARCLSPVDDLFAPSQLEAWAADTVGPSLDAYRMNRRLWALPLDAATQVSARRADLVPNAPATWDDVLELSEQAPVALSLAGPHAFLTFCSIAVALGEEPDVGGGAAVISRPIGRRVLELLARLARSAPAGSGELNPIAMLRTMTEGSTIAYCPLIYGYVNYSHPQSQSSIAFADAPSIRPGGRPGSTVGGTGLALSARCSPSPLLLDHLRWLMDRRTQATFIPARSGQPSARSAWMNPLVNAAAENFYLSTLSTMERAWLRPRFPGYIPFQTAASALLRHSLATDSNFDGTLDALNDLYRNARAMAPAERSPVR